MLLILKEGFQLIEGKISRITLPPLDHKPRSIAVEIDMISVFYELDLIFPLFQAGDKCSFYGWGEDTGIKKYATRKLRVKQIKVGSGKMCKFDYPSKRGQLRKSLKEEKTFCAGSLAYFAF